jgi:hypothetical protein
LERQGHRSGDSNELLTRGRCSARTLTCQQAKLVEHKDFDLIWEFVENHGFNIKVDENLEDAKEL